jgi:hypothetical protein
LGFEVRDALVVEPEVLPCGLEFLLKYAVVGGERADVLLERGVLGGDPLESTEDEWREQFGGREFRDLSILVCRSLASLLLPSY